MSRIFAFCNQKGGVGKTTSAVNIAAMAARKGYKCLLIDMDAQGNATSGVGVEKEDLKSTAYQLLVDNLPAEEIIVKTPIENLDLLPSNTDLSGADIDLVNFEKREYVLQGHLQPLLNKYDYLFIDCPPSLGLITINCLVASNSVIIPLQCEYYALEGLGQLLHTYQLVHDNLNEDLEVGGVILTMADFRTNLTQQVIEEVRGYFKEKAFETVIPRAVKISEAPSFGKPAVIYDPYNKASKGYEGLAEEFFKRFGRKAGDGLIDLKPGEQETSSGPGPEKTAQHAETTHENAGRQES